MPAPRQDQPLFVIIGPSGHGKTTVRKMIQEKTGLRGDGTSNVIYAMLAFLSGKPEEKLRAIPKEEFRPRLVEFGDWITATVGELSAEVLALIPEEKRDTVENVGRQLREPAALSRLLFLGGSQVLEGIRRPREFLTMMTHLTWCGYQPVVVWVEDPRKETNPRDNFSITREIARPSVVFQNDGTLDDLELHVDKLLTQMGWKEPVPMGTPDPVLFDGKGREIVEGEEVKLVTPPPPTDLQGRK